MPTRVVIPHRPIEHIAVAIERLRVGRPPRVAGFLLVFVAQLEPEGLPVLAMQGCAKPNLMEIDRQRFQGNALYAAAGTAWHHAIRADKPRQHRIIHAGVVVEQAGAVQPLAGEAERGLGQVATAQTAFERRGIEAAVAHLRERKRDVTNAGGDRLGLIPIGIALAFGRARLGGRDVSFRPRTDTGTRAWDTFQTIIAIV